MTPVFRKPLEVAIQDPSGEVRTFRLHREAWAGRSPDAPILLRDSTVPARVLHLLRASEDEIWLRTEPDAPALELGDLAVDGNDLIAELGAEPGPVLGHVLRELLERVVADPALNDRPTLLVLAQALDQIGGAISKQLLEFDRAVHDMQRNRAASDAELKAQLVGLARNTQDIGLEANRLRAVLTNSRVRGAWTRGLRRRRFCAACRRGNPSSATARRGSVPRSWRGDWPVPAALKSSISKAPSSTGRAKADRSNAMASPCARCIRSTGWAG